MTGYFTGALHIIPNRFTEFYTQPTLQGIASLRWYEKPSKAADFPRFYAGSGNGYCCKLGILPDDTPKVFIFHACYSVHNLQTQKPDCFPRGRFAVVNSQYSKEYR